METLCPLTLPLYQSVLGSLRNVHLNFQYPVRVLEMGWNKTDWKMESRQATGLQLLKQTAVNQDQRVFVSSSEAPRHFHK